MVKEASDTLNSLVCRPIHWKK